MSPDSDLTRSAVFLRTLRSVIVTKDRLSCKPSALLKKLTTWLVELSSADPGIPPVDRPGASSKKNMTGTPGTEEIASEDDWPRPCSHLFCISGFAEMLCPDHRQVSPDSCLAYSGATGFDHPHLCRSDLVFLVRNHNFQTVFTVLPVVTLPIIIKRRTDPGSVYIRADGQYVTRTHGRQFSIRMSEELPE